MKLFIFAAGETRADHLRVVLAKDRTDAENIILSDKQEPLCAYLREQMEHGVYQYCRTIREALREYFPVVSERAVTKRGTIFGVRGGNTVYLSR